MLTECLVDYQLDFLLIVSHAIDIRCLKLLTNIFYGTKVLVTITGFSLANVFMPSSFLIWSVIIPFNVDFHPLKSLAIFNKYEKNMIELLLVLFRLYYITEALAHIHLLMFYCGYFSMIIIILKIFANKRSGKSEHFFSTKVR